MANLLTLFPIFRSVLSDGYPQFPFSRDKVALRGAKEKLKLSRWHIWFPEMKGSVELNLLFVHKRITEYRVRKKEK